MSVPNCISMEVIETEYQLVPISEFDSMARQKLFSSGPWISSLGDGQGDPYMPVRTVWGTLHDGRKIRAIKEL